MALNNPEEKEEKYICNFCAFTTCNKKDYNRHLETRKHKKNENATDLGYFTPDDKKVFKCNCGKNYKHRSSLYKHKKTCNIKYKIVKDENLVIKELKTIILDQQNKIKEQNKQINDLIPKIGSYNNNKQKFNINVFLNEECKDAISINDFVKSIEVTLSNLLITGEKGLGTGINNIINENMKKLSVYERPIHCTDKKRETLYVKNEKWEKDNDKSKTSGMLKSIQLKQIKNLHKWQDDHPNYLENEKELDEYTLLVNKCTKSLNDYEKNIFKNLCESTYVKDN